MKIYEYPNGVSIIKNELKHEFTVVVNHQVIDKCTFEDTAQHLAENICKAIDAYKRE